MHDKWKEYVLNSPQNIKYVWYSIHYTFFGVKSVSSNCQNSADWLWLSTSTLASTPPNYNLEQISRECGVIHTSSEWNWRYLLTSLIYIFYLLGTHLMTARPIMNVIWYLWLIMPKRVRDSCVQFSHCSQSVFKICSSRWKQSVSVFSWVLESFS